MSPENSLKLRWMIIVVLGLCFIVFPVTHVMAEKISGPLDRQASVDNWVFPSKVLAQDYFFVNSLSDEKYIFESEGNELLLAANNSYFPALRERAEQTSLRGKVKLDSDYFKGIFTDTGYALTSPWRWDKSDWATASIVAGVTGIFFVLDDELREDFKEGRSSTTDDISSVFEPFGNSAIILPAMAGFYLYGYLGENEKVERVSLLAVESLLVTGLFTTIVKVSMGRTRPFDGVPNDEFKGPRTGNNSLPSGHTSTAFTIATVMANEYEHVPLVSPISYGLATLTGLSRLNDQKHWASDVVLGAALGYFTAKTILKLHSNKKGQHFTIYPRADYRGGGLVLSSRF